MSGTEPYLNHPLSWLHPRFLSLPVTAPFHYLNFNHLYPPNTTSYLSGFLSPVPSLPIILLPHGYAHFIGPTTLSLSLLPTVSSLSYLPIINSMVNITPLHTLSTPLFFSLYHNHLENTPHFVNFTSLLTPDLQPCNLNIARGKK